MYASSLFAALSLHIVMLKRKGHFHMSTIEHVLPVEAHNMLSWQGYLLDSVLAFGGAMLVTWVIYLFQLYPRIPNISIVYLLVVLALASTRGRYPATLASLVAFLAFDYFYDLVRVTNREGEPERQLHTIARSVVDVLSSWGVHDCAILQ